MSVNSCIVNAACVPCIIMCAQALCVCMYVCAHAHIVMQCMYVFLEYNTCACATRVMYGWHAWMLSACINIIHVLHECSHMCMIHNVVHIIHVLMQHHNCVYICIMQCTHENAHIHQFTHMHTYTHVIHRELIYISKLHTQFQISESHTCMP